MNHYDRQIIRLAIPSIVSNITVPILSMVDLAIVGHMGSANYIGAVAVGGMIFNIIYWLFGFLRMNTSGLTAQTNGKGEDTTTILTSSLKLAMIISLIILILQEFLFHISLRIIQPAENIYPLVKIYFYIVVWGAPAILAQYVLTGWFIGMQDTKIPMLISISQNLINIVCSLSLVYFFDQKIEGVAFGTLIAQWSGFVMSIWGICHFNINYKSVFSSFIHSRPITNKNQATGHLSLFIRTLCMVAVTLFFTSLGARQGTIILAVNTLLMSLFTLFSYFMDGFAFAGEALCGRYWGAGNMQSFREAIKHLFGWGFLMIFLFTSIYFWGGEHFLSLLTDQEDIIKASAPYFLWAVAIPLAGMMAFVLDGIFVGISQTRGMLLSTLTGASIFFITWITLWSTLGNHALWLSFILYLLLRGIVELIILLRHYKQLFA